MNKHLMQILEQLVNNVSCTMCGTLNDNPKQIRQAHDQIVELWKKSLPKKAKHGIRSGEYEDGFVDGINEAINEAITQAEKNMEG